MTRSSVLLLAATVLVAVCGQHTALAAVTTNREWPLFVTIVGSVGEFSNYTRLQAFCGAMTNVSGIQGCQIFSVRPSPTVQNAVRIGAYFYTSATITTPDATITAITNAFATDQNVGGIIRTGTITAATKTTDAPEKFNYMYMHIRFYFRGTQTGTSTPLTADNLRTKIESLDLAVSVSPGLTVSTAATFENNQIFLTSARVTGYWTNRNTMYNDILTKLRDASGAGAFILVHTEDVTQATADPDWTEAGYDARATTPANFPYRLVITLSSSSASAAVSALLTTFRNAVFDFLYPNVDLAPGTLSVGTIAADGSGSRVPITVQVRSADNLLRILQMLNDEIYSGNSTRATFGGVAFTGIYEYATEANTYSAFRIPTTDFPLQQRYTIPVDSFQRFINQSVAVNELCAQLVRRTPNVTACYIETIATTTPVARNATGKKFATLAVDSALSFVLNATDAAAAVRMKRNLQNTLLTAAPILGLNFNDATVAAVVREESWRPRDQKHAMSTDFYIPSSGVTEKAEVTFAAGLPTGKSITIGGLTLTAGGTPVALADFSAFQSLANGATAGSATPATGTWSGSLSGWTTSVAGGNKITFTSTTAAANVPDLQVSGTDIKTITAAPTPDNNAANEKNTVVFAASLPAGKSVTLAGLTFTAGPADVTTASLATAFGSLTSGATTGRGADFGTYSGTLTGWGSAAPSGANLNEVVFTSTGTGDVANIVPSGSDVTALTSIVTTQGDLGNIISIDSVQERLALLTETATRFSANPYPVLRDVTYWMSKTDVVLTTTPANGLNYTAWVIAPRVLTPLGLYLRQLFLFASDGAATVFGSSGTINAGVRNGLNGTGEAFAVTTRVQVTLPAETTPGAAGTLGYASPANRGDTGLQDSFESAAAAAFNGEASLVFDPLNARAPPSTSNFVAPIKIFTSTAQSMASIVAQHATVLNFTTGRTFGNYLLRTPGYESAVLTPELDYRVFPAVPTTPTTATPATTAPATAPAAPVAPSVFAPGAVNGVQVGVDFYIIIPPVIDPVAFCNAILAQGSGAPYNIRTCQVRSNETVSTLPTGTKFAQQVTYQRMVVVLTTADPTSANSLINNIITGINNKTFLRGFNIADVNLVALSALVPTSTNQPQPAVAPTVPPATNGTFTTVDIYIVILGTALDSAGQAALNNECGSLLGGGATCVTKNIEQTTAARKMTTQASALRLTETVRAPASTYPSANAIVARLQAAVRSNNNRLGGQQVVSIATIGNGSSAAARTVPALLAIFTAAFVVVLSMMAQF